MLPRSSSSALVILLGVLGIAFSALTSTPIMRATARVQGPGAGSAVTVSAGPAGAQTSSPAGSGTAAPEPAPPAAVSPLFECESKLVEPIESAFSLEPASGSRFAMHRVLRRHDAPDGSPAGSYVLRSSRLLASAASGSRIAWITSSGQLVVGDPFHPASSWPVDLAATTHVAAFDDAGDVFAVATSSSTIAAIRNVDGFGAGSPPKYARIILPPGQPMRSLAVNGGALAAGLADGSVVFRASEGASFETEHIAGGPIEELAIDGTGRVVAASRDGSLTRWSPSAKKDVLVPAGRHGTPRFAIATGDLIAYADDAAVTVRYRETPFTLTLPGVARLALRAPPRAGDPVRVAMATSNGQVLVWNVDEDKVTPVADASGRITAIGFDATGAIFFASTADDAPAPSGASVHGARFDAVTDDLRSRAAAGVSIDFAIAMFPDPIDSGLYAMSDQFVDGLDRGIEASGGWIRDRFWLPWRDLSGRRPGNVEPPESCRRLVPGVLLFRNTGTSAGRDGLLVVLLVGETPTWGLHTRALTEALDLIDASAPVAGHRGGDGRARGLRPIRIIGPTFSGSTASLRTTLDHWLESRGHVDDSCFSLISPGATNESNKELLDTCAPVGTERGPMASRCEQVCAGAPGPKIDFHATIVPDDIRDAELYRYLYPNGGPCTGMALLQESGTTYAKVHSPVDAGASDASGPESSAQDGGAATSGSAGDPGDQPASEAPGRDGCPQYRIRFPLHISAIRRAYDTLESSETSASTRPLAPTFLDPTLDEPSDPLDVFPTLSSKTTFSNDLALSDIISQLRSGHATYVGIQATDPSDTIFLAERLRPKLPDARFFTFGADILFAHPKYASALQGLLVVTPYPLVTDAQRWVSHFAADIQPFTSDLQQAAFNAAEATLAPDTPLLGYTRQSSTGVQDEPPLWITAVAKGDFVPLQYFGDYVDRTDYVLNAQDGSSQKNDHAFTPTPVPSSGWTLLVTLVFVFLGCNLFAEWDANRADLPDSDGRLTGRLRIGRYLYGSPPAPPELLCWHELYAGACLLGLAVTCVPLWALTLVPHLYERPGDCHHTLADVALAVLCVFLILRAFMRGFRRMGAALTGPVFSVAVEAAVPLLSLALLAWTSFTLWPADAAHGGLALLCERATAVGSGTSIITPFLFLAAVHFLWCHFHLRRVTNWNVFVRTGADSTPLAVAEILADEDVAVLEDLAREPIARAFLNRGAWVLVPALVLIVCAFWSHPVSLLEADLAPIDGLFAAAFLVVFLVTVAASTHLLLAWWRVNRLFERIVRTPLVGALGRLSKAFVRTLEAQLSGRSPDIRELDVPIRQLQLMASAQTTSETRFATAEKYEEVAKCFNEERLAFAKGARKSPAQSDTVNALVDIAIAVHGKLRLAWNTRDPKAVGDVLKDQAAEVLSSPAESNSLASRNTLGLMTARVDSAEELLLRTAEDFVASVVTLIAYQYIRQFRHWLTFITTSTLLLMMAIASYSFQPRRELLVSVWVLTMFVATSAVIVLVGMGRSEFLSRVTKTKPGEVTFDSTFVVNVLTWAALPIVSMLAVQYPDVAGYVLALIHPGQGAR